MLACVGDCRHAVSSIPLPYSQVHDMYLCLADCDMHSWFVIVWMMIIHPCVVYGLHFFERRLLCQSPSQRPNEVRFMGKLIFSHKPEGIFLTKWVMDDEQMMCSGKRLVIFLTFDIVSSFTWQLLLSIYFILLYSVLFHIYAVTSWSVLTLVYGLVYIPSFLLVYSSLALQAIYK